MWVYVCVLLLLLLLFVELENVLIKTMFGSSNLIKLRMLDIKQRNYQTISSQLGKNYSERAKD